MDPNKTLHDILGLVAVIHAADDHDRAVDPHAALQLADRVEQLDDWLARGGFLPERWQKQMRNRSWSVFMPKRRTDGTK